LIDTCEAVAVKQGSIVIKRLTWDGFTRRFKIGFQRERIGKLRE
jgi:hypothetical protein